MSKADRSYSYRTSCGQIAGRSHLQSNAPCQDYVVARAQRDVACVALADGAGSRSHSEHGARVVVRATTRLLMDQFEEIWALAGTNPSQAAAELLDHCLTALQRRASERNCAVSALASTLLFVAHSKGRFLAGHVGDGCIIHLQDDGQIVVLSHPDNGEYANTTFFVTDATAHDRFRLYRGHCAQGSGFVIMSDGTAESLYRRLDKTPASAALRRMFAWSNTSTPTEMRDALSRNLREIFAAKSADDCSIGVLTISCASESQQAD